jgi:hypothetical protein
LEVSIALSGNTEKSEESKKMGSLFLICMETQKIKEILLNLIN